jgi:hypothetical protein
LSAGQPLRSIGTDRVRLSFNPGGNPQVEAIKRQAAGLIDLCEDMKRTEIRGEVLRLIALAQTAAEDAAMWAVKAATAE